MTIIAVLFLLATLFIYHSLYSKEAAIDSIAVMPITASETDFNAQEIGDGITASLVESLSQVPNLKVMSRSSVMRYRGKDIDPKVVGRELNVKAVLTGRLVQRGDNVDLSAELVNASDDTHVWGKEYSRSVSEILLLQQELARNISTKLKPKLSSNARERIAKQGTADPEAYQFYVKAQTYQDTLNVEGWKKALEFFQKAVAKDPNYASAYAGMAHAYSWLGFFGVLPEQDALKKANEAANKAIQLDDSISEAHAALGYAALFNWKWRLAEQELRQAIALNQNLPLAHLYYGQFLAAQGRMDEAIDEHKHFLELDPTSQVANQVLCAVYGSAREYDESIHQCLKVVEMNPEVAMPHSALSTDYAQKKNYAKALAEYQRELTLDGNLELSAAMGRAYAANGWEGVLRKRVQIDQRRDASDYDPVAVALCYASLGEKEKAFLWLERAYDEHAGGLLFIKATPDFDNIRSDPRYADLLRRVGLPQ